MASSSPSTSGCITSMRSSVTWRGAQRGRARCATVSLRWRRWRKSVEKEGAAKEGPAGARARQVTAGLASSAGRLLALWPGQIGRGAGRGRGENSGVAGSLKKKKINRGHTGNQHDLRELDKRHNAVRSVRGRCTLHSLWQY